MVYIREGKPLERLDKLLDFKFKADLDLVLYYHYLTIKKEELERIEADLEYNKGVYHV